MQRTLKRLLASVLLGTTLALGAITVGYIAQQPAVMQTADPGGGNGTGSGG
jgi:hypothetical protein